MRMRIIEHVCLGAQSGQMSSAAFAFSTRSARPILHIHWFGLVLATTRLLLVGGHVNSSFTTFEAPIHLTKQAHQMGVQCMGVRWSLDDIIWSSNCHLIADLRSLLGSVWYHGWIVPQSSDHDAVACVSVVTLLALLLTLGTFGNHTSSPPQTQHKSSTLLF